MSCGGGSGGSRWQGFDPLDQAVLQGTVARQGKPAGGAYVRLLDATGEFVAEVRTGPAGDFRFFAAPGDWTVRVLAPQVHPMSCPVTVSLGRVTEIALDL